MCPDEIADLDLNNLPDFLNNAFIRLLNQSSQLPLCSRYMARDSWLKSSDMEIRLAEPGDEDKLIRLFRNLYQESDYLLLEKDEFVLTAEEQAKIIEDHMGSTSWVLFVAEIGSDLVGFLGGTGGHVKRNRHSVQMAMGVLRKHQSMGLGRQLLQAFITWAVHNRYHRIELAVVETNHRAISLYQSLGFEFEGLKRHSLKVHGNYVNEHCMAKLI
jgi:RimJ/RimL family protein N-acetyltransferase